MATVKFKKETIVVYKPVGEDEEDYLFEVEFTDLEKALSIIRNYSAFMEYQAYLCGLRCNKVEKG